MTTTPDPYEALGVGRDASPEDIKRAYRRKAQETHPDKGGSAVKFVPVQRAYALLASPSRKAEYDKTGRDPGEHRAEEDSRTKMLRRIASMFLGACEELNPETDHIIERVQEAIENIGINTRRDIDKLRARVAKLERAKPRLKWKNKGAENVLVGVLDSQITKLNEAIERGEEEMANISLMLLLLAEYDWEVDEQGMINMSIEFRS